MEFFRIPEVLNYLRQYREVLSENKMDIPLWVYCLTQDIKNLKEAPKPFILDFLINFGLFNRRISRQGWPQYIVGYDSLMSVLSGEISFEEQALLLSNGYCQKNEKLQVYRASSFYNNQTGSFCLTSLKKKLVSSSLSEVLNYLKQKIKENSKEGESFFYLLSPHKEDFMENLKSHGIFPKDFLEEDQALNWLWPIWKKMQVWNLRNAPSELSWNQ